MSLTLAATFSASFAGRWNSRLNNLHFRLDIIILMILLLIIVIVIIVIVVVTVVIVVVVIIISTTYISEYARALRDQRSPQSDRLGATKKTAARPAWAAAALMRGKSEQSTSWRFRICSLETKETTTSAAERSSRFRVLVLKRRSLK